MFADYMEGWLVGSGYEEDEFAEGTGRTFRWSDILTVYFEEFGDREYLHISHKRNSWDDDGEWAIEVPRSLMDNRDFQKFVMKVIDYKCDEEIN